MKTSERGKVLPFWVVEDTGFPWKSHRDWREVRETERLRALKATDYHKFITSARAPRLQALEARAVEPQYRDSTPGAGRMTRPAKPSENHAADVMALGRDGVSFAAISERVGGTIDRCKWVWHCTATVDDERARHAAKVRARVYTKRRIVETALRSPAHEKFAPNAFGNNTHSTIYGKTMQPELNHSSTGCAAAMVCS